MKKLVIKLSNGSLEPIIIPKEYEDMNIEYIEEYEGNEGEEIMKSVYNLEKYYLIDKVNLIKNGKKINNLPQVCQMSTLHVKVDEIIDYLNK